MKCVILVTILVLLAARCGAQGFSYGITLGGDLGNESDGVRSFEYGNTWFYSHHEIEPGGGTFYSELGFVGGFEFDYRFSSNVAVSGSALFDQKGVGLNFIYTTESSPAPIATAMQDITLDYLEIPVLAKWEPFSEGAGAFLFAGPSVGFLLSGKSQLSLHVANEANNAIPLTQKDPSVSAVAGIGFGFDLAAKLRCEISVAYAWSLTNDSFSEPQSEPYYRDPVYSATAGDVRATVTVLFPGW
jgi:Outer membrane protein beta-barrel domain